MTAIYAHRGNAAWPGAGSESHGAVSGDGMPPGAGASGCSPGGGERPPARENTLEAFGAARRAGADGVELDVRLSADDVPVIHHDRRLPDGRVVANIARSSLPHYVPSLAEALHECAGLSVNIEVKHEEGDRRTAAVVAETLGRYRLAQRPGRPAHDVAQLPPVLVSSFDEESLAVIRKALPSVPLGLLVDWNTTARAALARAAALGCATLHPFVTQVDAGLVTAATAAGLGLHVWTVNADADIAAMVELQVTAIITDRVAAAVPIVRGPAAWPGPKGRAPGRRTNGDGVTG